MQHLETLFQNNQNYITLLEPIIFALYISLTHWILRKCRINILIRTEYKFMFVSNLIIYIISGIFIYNKMIKSLCIIPLIYFYISISDHLGLFEAICNCMYMLYLCTLSINNTDYIINNMYNKN